MEGDLDAWVVGLWTKLLSRHPVPLGCVVDDAPRLEAPRYVVNWAAEGGGAALGGATMMATPPAAGSMSFVPAEFYCAPAETYEPEAGPCAAVVEVNRRVTNPEWTQARDTWTHTGHTLNTNSTLSLAL